MTQLLQRAFDIAASLPPAEQDLLANWLLAELEPEDAFDRRIQATAGNLTPMAQQALAELDAGQTQPLNLDRP